MTFNPQPISIHAPRVRCDFVSLRLYGYIGISIHAPRVRCDITQLMYTEVHKVFQSTHLV